MLRDIQTLTEKNGFGRIDMQAKIGAQKNFDRNMLRVFDAEMQMVTQLMESEETGENTDMGMRNSSMLTLGVQDERMQNALITLSRIFDRQQAQNTAQVQNTYQHAAGSSLPAQNTSQVPSNETQSKTILDFVHGKLSAHFESGSKGSGCIAYDKIGGTSYGTYQIASRTGTMDRFVDFLASHAPDIAEKLRSAAPFNTGSKFGKAPELWQNIAKEYGEVFESLQHQFIQKEHYTPARNKILAFTGMDIDKSPDIVREVLWSTSVQHGATGAARLFNRAIQSMPAEGEHPDFRQLISAVYDGRKGQFGSSTTRVQHSVQTRLAREQDLAIAMLEKETGSIA